MIQDAKLLFMLFVYVGVLLDLCLQIYYAISYYDADDDLDKKYLADDHDHTHISFKKRMNQDANSSELVELVLNIRCMHEPLT